MICTDILYLFKLLGLPVIPKSTLTTLTVASGDASRLPLAAWLVVTFWEVSGVEVCRKLSVAEFESTSNSVQCGYKFKLKVPASTKTRHYNQILISDITRIHQYQSMK